ncbi:hypothetical protein [Parasitella parasitica]|uniref:Uncharacterized protein n=1 Tax=Parasitella parasitica TaxID=35722 RepID=A0A0B7NDB2_9FUNG|nr:hypothetical protein [Parasitella parasitica]
MGQDNKVLFEVILDELPDDTLTLYGATLKNDNNDGEDDDNLEDAEASEEEQEVVVESYEVWDARDVYTDFAFGFWHEQLFHQS